MKDLFKETELLGTTEYMTPVARSNILIYIYLLIFQV
jgi:hypothetical protein